MTVPPDMDREVNVTFDLATLLLFQEAVGFAGFHDPILDHLTDRQQKAVWEGSDILQQALWSLGIEDWDEAQALAQQTWDSRHTSE